MISTLYGFPGETPLHHAFYNLLVRSSLPFVTAIIFPNLEIAIQTEGYSDGYKQSFGGCLMFGAYGTRKIAQALRTTSSEISMTFNWYGSI